MNITINAKMYLKLVSICICKWNLYLQKNLKIINKLRTLESCPEGHQQPKKQKRVLRTTSSAAFVLFLEQGINLLLYESSAGNQVDGLPAVVN